GSGRMSTTPGTTHRPPPFDPELAAPLRAILDDLSGPLTPELIADRRARTAAARLTDDEIRRDGAFEFEERIVPGAVGVPVIICPMPDARCDTASAIQIDGVGLWDRTSDMTGWTALLGDRRGTGQVSCYAAPARATDLSGLPPAFIDVGSVEALRDSATAYA